MKSLLLNNRVGEERLTLGLHLFVIYLWTHFLMSALR